MSSRRGTTWMRMVPHIAAVVVVVLLVGLISALPADAVRTWHPAKAKQQKPVPGHDSGYRPRAAARTKPAPKPSAKVTWPKAGTADVAVPATGSVRAGGLPVRLGPSLASGKTKAGTARTANDVRVRVLDRVAATRAGVGGLLLTVATVPDGANRAGTGKARLQVDYSTFRGGGGGDWASRLRLATLPACALTTPRRPECRSQTPLPSDNNVAKGVVSADVGVADRPTATASGVVAVDAGASGPAGSYAATSLSPSSTWQVGAQTGDFSWSYPLRVPPSLGGPVPQIQLGYSSSAVDGQREILPALALLYRASEMIGRNPESEFSAIYHVSGGRVHALIDFLQRAPEDKTIQAMGFMEGDDRKGFRFIRNW